MCVRISSQVLNILSSSGQPLNAYCEERKNKRGKKTHKTPVWKSLFMGVLERKSGRNNVHQAIPCRKMGQFCKTRLEPQQQWRGCCPAWAESGRFWISPPGRFFRISLQICHKVAEFSWAPEPCPATDISSNSPALGKEP